MELLGDELPAALGAAHVVALPLRVGGQPGLFLTLPFQALGLQLGEVLFFVATGLVFSGHGVGRRLSADGYRLSAIGYRLTAIGYQLSADGYRLSAIGYRLTANG
jgi:hypothetical protein